MPLDKVSYQKWLSKRRWTTSAFVIQSFLHGFEYSIIFANLWIFIETLVQPVHPELYYSIICSFFMLSSALLSLIVSKIADHYRCIRKIFIATNVTLIVGNVIYMIPFSPWYLLIGRIIAGAGHTHRSVIAGELARCYSQKELTSKFSMMGMADSLGFTVAPAINIAFSSVEIKLGSLVITFANLSGIYLPLIYILAVIMSTYMVYDLSKEFDQKFENEKESDEKERMLSGNSSLSEVKATAEKASVSIIMPNNLIEEAGQKSSLKWLCREILTHYDTALLMGLSFLDSFIVTSTDMLVPMIVIDYLKWPVVSLNSIILGSGLASIVPGIVLMIRRFSDRHLFYTSVLSVFMYGVSIFILLSLSIYSKNRILNIILATIYCALFAIISIIQDVFISAFLAKMVSSVHQALADSNRELLARLGSITAMLTAPFVLEYLEIIGWFYIFIVLIFVFLLIFRRKTLKNPLVIIRRPR